MWEHKPAPLPYNGNRRYYGVHVPSFRGIGGHKPHNLKPKQEPTMVGDPLDKVVMQKRHNYNNNACNKHAKRKILRIAP